MKKINKSLPPNQLTHFAANHPAGRWEHDFKQHNGGADYKLVKATIFADQSGLCAYCEIKVGDATADKQRVEHFHPKSDRSNPGKNWALDWNNVIGVCIGGNDADKTMHPLPVNLSCDSYKDHLISKNKLPEQCDGHLLNPLNIIATPALFQLNKANGELLPAENLHHINIDDNIYATTRELVQKTIEILNLNCDRLTQQRIAVRHEYNRQIAQARKVGDKDIHSKLSRRWFQQRWPSFFTTRRLLLGNHAETYLTDTHFNG